MGGTPVKCTGNVQRKRWPNMLEEFKALIAGALLVVILSLSAGIWYEHKEVLSLTETNGELTSAVDAKRIELRTCTSSIEKLVEDQKTQSDAAAVALAEAKKSSSKNYANSTSILVYKPISPDDYVSAKDLMNKYIDDRSKK